MANSWKLTLPCHRNDSDRLSEEIPEITQIEPLPVITTRAIEEDSDDWVLEAFFEGKPKADVVKLITGLVPNAKNADAKLEQLPDEDWVTISQAGLEPIQIGCFFIHNGTEAAIEKEASSRGLTPLQVEASRAFGTGHHETTSGCLTAIDALKQSGARFHNIADIGTGTGLLAMAAHHLWPRAQIVASDIDPQAIEVCRHMAAQNAIPLGRGKGRLAMVTANGTDHKLIARRAPYDLVIANILAGPLIELAPAFSAITADRGTLLLAGLMAKQVGAVKSAYLNAGFRLDKRSDIGVWPTLQLTKRSKFGHRRPQRSPSRTSQREGDYGEW